MDSFAHKTPVYRTLRTAIVCKDAATKRSIAAFNAFFPAHHVKLELAASGVLIRLHTVDMKVLAKKVCELSDTTGTGVLHEVLRVIEGVKSYGLSAGKRLYVGYKAERKVADRAKKEQKRGQHFYADTEGSSRDNGVLQVAFENRILCADSLSALRKIGDRTIDLIFTSPPYNFGLTYASESDALRWEAYFETLFAIFDECIRVLKYGARIVVNVQPLFSDYIPSHHMIADFFRRRKLIWKGEILWEKHNYNCKYTAWGSWKSPSSPYLKYTWEFLEVFCKGSLKKAGNRADADITSEEFKEWVVAKWSIAPARDMKKYGHPAMFPEALAERVIKLFSFRGDVVLDPFNGVGTTTVVAKRLQRRYVGIDISEEYCAMARRRLRESLGMKESNKQKVVV